MGAITQILSGYYVAPTGGGTDADATIYIAALISAGVTPSSPQQTALHTFFSSSKTDGWWTNSVAIYFPIWSNATANTINLRNPGTYNLTFVNSPTMGTDGVAWDGTTQYATTGIKTNALNQNDAHISYYSQTNNTTNIGYEIGVVDGTVASAIRIRSTTSLGGRSGGNVNGAAASVVNPAANSVRLQTVSRTSSTALVYYRAASIVQTLSNSSVASGSTYDYMLGANNSSGTPVSFSNRKMSYADFGSGLSGIQEIAHEATIQTLHTSFGIAQ